MSRRGTRRSRDSQPIPVSELPHVEYEEAVKRLAIIPRLPSAISRLSAELRVKGREVWEAANRLVVALDLSHNWYTTLWFNREFPDPSVLNRCLATATQSIGLLVGWVRVPPFQDATVESLCESLPPIPTWQVEGVDYDWDSRSQEIVCRSRTRWQDDPELWERWYQPGRQSDKSLALRASAFQLCQTLKSYPTPLLGVEPQPVPNPSRNRGGRRRDERLWGEVMPVVQQLRAENVPWKELTRRINDRFGTKKYRVATLVRHLRTFKTKGG